MASFVAEGDQVAEHGRAIAVSIGAARRSTGPGAYETFWPLACKIKRPDLAPLCVKRRRRARF